MQPVPMMADEIDAKPSFAELREESNPR